MDTYTTVQDIRDRGVTVDTATDSEVETALARGTLLVEAFAGRDFWCRLRTFQLDGNGLETLFLEDRPILDIQNLWVDGVLIDPGSYEVYGEEGYIRLSTGTHLPWAALAGVFPRGAKNVKVEGDFGFDEVPRDVFEACVILALAEIKTLRQEAGSSDSLVSAAAAIRRVKVDDISVDFDNPERFARQRQNLKTTGDSKADRLLTKYRTRIHPIAV